MASLTEVPAGVRGAVLGLNTTTMSAGWLAASALGGWLIAWSGFAALAVFSALAGLLGAALAAAASRLRPPAP
jgi:predicted MFS family arabinose efflux permease